MSTIGVQYTNRPNSDSNVIVSCKKKNYSNNSINKSYFTSLQAIFLQNIYFTSFLLTHQISLSNKRSFN